MTEITMKWAAATAALVLTAWAGQALAQAPLPGASAPVQSSTANGVIVLAMPPAVTAPQGTPPSTSLIWLYDTNLKELILCTSHADGGFNCTGGYKPGW